MPVIRATTSFRLARCCTLTVVMTAIPSASTSNTSSQRLARQAAGDVGVGQLVDQGDLGVPGDHGLGVQFLERGPAVLDELRRDDLEPLEHLDRQRPAVRLHEADHDVRPAVPPALALGEHREGLPDARRGPQVDPQGRALARLRLLAGPGDLDDRLGDLKARQRLDGFRNPGPP